MKILISYFYNTRFFKSNQIGISTAVWNPKYYKLGQNQHDSILGISEPSLSPKTIDPVCSKDCPYKKDLPNCPFLVAYRNYLDTVDFNYLMTEFNRIAEEVKKINNYEGEPEIILLVYETPDNPCSERQSLIDYFRKQGIKIEEYVKETS